MAVPGQGKRTEESGGRSYPSGVRETKPRGTDEQTEKTRGRDRPDDEMVADPRSTTTKQATESQTRHPSQTRRTAQTHAHRPHPDPRRPRRKNLDLQRPNGRAHRPKRNMEDDGSAVQRTDPRKTGRTIRRRRNRTVLPQHSADDTPGKVGKDTKEIGYGDKDIKER